MYYAIWSVCSGSWLTEEEQVLVFRTENSATAWVKSNLQPHEQLDVRVYLIQLNTVYQQ